MRPDFIDFILKDVNSVKLKEYITNLENTIERIEELVNNEKITGIESKLIIKDLLKEIKNDIDWDWNNHYSNSINYGNNRELYKMI